MPRPPALKRPALLIMQRELKRIEKLQLAAEKENRDYPLSEDERAAVLDAAKVGALLERGPKGGDDDGEEQEKSPVDEKAALERLESKLPPKVTRGPSEEDEGS